MNRDRKKGRTRSVRRQNMRDHHHSPWTSLCTIESFFKLVSCARSQNILEFAYDPRGRCSVWEWHRWRVTEVEVEINALRTIPILVLVPCPCTTMLLPWNALFACAHPFRVDWIFSICTNTRFPSHFKQETNRALTEMPSYDGRLTHCMFSFFKMSWAQTFSGILWL